MKAFSHLPMPSSVKFTCSHVCQYDWAKGSFHGTYSLPAASSAQPGPCSDPFSALLCSALVPRSPPKAPGPLTSKRVQSVEPPEGSVRVGEESAARVCCATSTLLQHHPPEVVASLHEDKPCGEAALHCLGAPVTRLLPSSHQPGLPDASAWVTSILWISHSIFLE